MSHHMRTRSMGGQNTPSTLTVPPTTNVPYTLPSGNTTNVEPTGQENQVCPENKEDIPDITGDPKSANPVGDLGSGSFGTSGMDIEEEEEKKSYEATNSNGGNGGLLPTSMHPQGVSHSLGTGGIDSTHEPMRKRARTAIDEFGRIPNNISHFRGNQIPENQQFAGLTGARAFNSENQFLAAQAQNQQQQYLGNMLAAMADNTSGDMFKFDISQFKSKSLYHTGDSNLGLLRKVKGKGAYFEFKPASFVNEFLPGMYPDCIGEFRTRLAAQRNIPGLTKENCLKENYFDPAFHGFPRLILDQLLEYGALSMERAGHHHGDMLTQVMHSHRELNKLCIRYDNTVQELVIRRLGDRLVSTKGCVDVLESVKESIKEVTAQFQKVSAFRLNSGHNGHPVGSGLANTGGGRNRRRGRAAVNWRTVQPGGPRSFENRPHGSGNSNWGNPDHPDFIPRGYCMQHHSSGTSCTRGRECRFKHERWTPQFEQECRERVRNSQRGRNGSGNTFGPPRH